MLGAGDKHSIIAAPTRDRIRARFASLERKLLALGGNRRIGECAIPDELSLLPNLTELSLPDMGLRGPIPEALAGRDALRVLDLSGNRLSGILPRHFSPRLETLVLGQVVAWKDSWNAFEGGVPAEWGALTALRRLNLAKCALDGGSLIIMSFAEPEYFRAELAERFERALVTRVDLHHLEQMLPRAFSLILHIKGHFLQLVHLSSISFRPRGCLRVQTVHAHDDLAHGVDPNRHHFSGAPLGDELVRDRAHDAMQRDANV